LDWKEELGRWLKPFLDRLGHKARRQMCPLYVSGLIGPGDRKSIQPMAERLALGGYDQLHHFIAAGVWDAAPVERELLVQADRLVGGSDAVLVIDDTALAKKGTHSVGVAPPVCFGTRQDRQLPDPGVAHAGARRSTGHAGVAVVSFGELDAQSDSVGASGSSGRISNGPDEAGDGPCGD
jgi:DDE superfamily endonuclease